MKDQGLHEQVELIREVFYYTQRYAGAVFVIKIDSLIVQSPLFPLLVKDISILHKAGIKIILVPGAKERIDEVLSQYKVKTENAGRDRISTKESIPFIKMAAFDISNTVMTHLAGNNVNGVIGNWVRARAKGVIDGTDYQSTGVIERVQTEDIFKVLNDGIIPIFPCIGWSSLGKPYNISSDELAFSLSTSIKADKLFFIRSIQTGIPKKATESISNIIFRDDKVSRMPVDSAEKVLSCIEDDADRHLLYIASRACRLGVERVHILNGHISGILLKEIFSNVGSGLLIHANPYESIRSMRPGDIPDVLSLMNPLVEKGVLIERDQEFFTENFQDFAVYEVDGAIHACASLHKYTEKQAEIAGLAVDQMFKHLGIGARMVTYLLEQAAARKIEEVFVLTTQTIDWFLSMGFKEADIEEIPQEKQQNYNTDRSSRVLVFRLKSTPLPQSVTWESALDA
ncbi:MAG: amino-acid N-acetyltransferase [Spirochaetia bacterium]